MNKNRVDEYLPRAIVALSKCEIANTEDGSLSKTYRGQISSFGAAITMGSFKAAVAYLAADSQNEDSNIKRSKLLQAIDYVAGEQDENQPQKVEEICKRILNTNNSELNEIQDKYIDASIALKLAMNAYKLVKN